jgi:hydroxymethylbilane synthase
MSAAPGVMRLATRGSPLALWQAHRVAALLAASGVEAEPVIVDTEGDRHIDISLAELGGQGVFVKEVQAVVVRGDADAAVHSAKDLPASDDLGVPGLVLAAFPERGDPRDALVGARIETLPTGATIATGSARRRVQLANLRPDLFFTDLRGNLATRLARVGEEGITAVVAARAALDRLDWRPSAGLEHETLEPSVMLPQVAQGALAIECRVDDVPARLVLNAIDDTAVRTVVEAERAFLAELGGGCTLPVGAHAVLEDPGAGGPRLRLTGMLAGPDGHVVLRREESGDDGTALGRSVARYLLDDAGGADLGPWSPAT